MMLTKFKIYFHIHSFIFETQNNKMHLFLNLLFDEGLFNSVAAIS